MTQGTAVQAGTQAEWARGRRVAFYVAVGLCVLAMLLAGPILTLPVTAWLPEATLNAMFGEENLGIHRVHMQGASVLFWITIVAMVAQFRRPELKAAPLWAAALGWAVFLPIELTLKVDPYSVAVTAVVLSVLVLHPSRWPTRPVDWRPWSTRLAVPMIVVTAGYALRHLMLQLSAVPADPHAAASHYGLMTAAGLGVAVAALLGATDVPGHLISAWTAALAALSFGVFSVGHPDQASSVGGWWGSALVVWSVAYLLASTYSRKRDVLVSR